MNMRLWGGGKFCQDNQAVPTNRTERAFLLFWLEIVSTMESWEIFKYFRPHNMIDSRTSMVIPGEELRVQDDFFLLTRQHDPT